MGKFRIFFAFSAKFSHFFLKMGIFWEKYKIFPKCSRDFPQCSQAYTTIYAEIDPRQFVFIINSRMEQRQLDLRPRGTNNTPPNVYHFETILLQYPNFQSISMDCPFSIVTLLLSASPLVLFPTPFLLYHPHFKHGVLQNDYYTPVIFQNGLEYINGWIYAWI